MRGSGPLPLACGGRDRGALRSLKEGGRQAGRPAAYLLKGVYFGSCGDTVEPCLGGWVPGLPFTARSRPVGGVGGALRGSPDTPGPWLFFIREAETATPRGK